MTSEQIVLTGASGAKYTYWANTVDGGWQSVAGNYLFCSRAGLGWAIHYAGECENCSNRLPNHERLAEAKTRYNVTHIFSHTSGGDDARKREERDIIQAYNPPMNVHHRTDGIGLGGIYTAR